MERMDQKSKQMRNNNKSLSSDLKKLRFLGLFSSITRILPYKTDTNVKNRYWKFPYTS
jgi:hypothetical protein